jgi:hypothetical protein
MKKYLFGLGAMLVGAGLMFVFTHTEVSAQIRADADFKCKKQIMGEWIKERNGFRRVGRFYECKKGKTTCYLFRSFGENAESGGLSCSNSGIF